MVVPFCLAKARVFCVFCVLTFALLCPAVVAAVDLDFPTPNKTLLTGGGEAFYQYIVRDLNGVKSTPWQGGQYGFVRNPVVSEGTTFYSRFHEGLDIKPSRRDAAGIPLDPVAAAAAGTVVFLNRTPRLSNYGNYVVIEHLWDGCPYYTLYGHLRSVAVEVGQSVAKGETIGMLGWTGDGIDLARAHLHFEINLKISDHFDQWHQFNFPNDPNRNGEWNGLNLVGIDPARFLLASSKNPSLTVPAFLANEIPAYKVTFPASTNFSALRRYPWLTGSNTSSNTGAWEVTFNRAAVPLKAEPSSLSVAVPTLTWNALPAKGLSYSTKRYLAPEPAGAMLTETGQRALRLYIFPD